MSESFWLYLFGVVGALSEGAKLILAALVILGILGALALKLLFKRLGETKTVAVEAREQSALAASRSEPTSNGFAGGVKQQLGEIADAVLRIENQVDRLAGRVAELERPSSLITSRRRLIVDDSSAAAED